MNTSPNQQIITYKERMAQSIIGQEKLGSRLLLILLSNGNVLLEGIPSLVKTPVIKSLEKHWIVV